MDYTGVAELTLSASASASASQLNSEDGEIEQPQTPSAGITPRPSFANLLFDQSGDNLELPPSSPPGPFDFSSADYDPFENKSLQDNLDSEDSEDGNPNTLLYCGGQPLQWTSGSVWDSYAYQLHNDDSLPWKLIGFKEDQFIIIQSRDACTGKLISDDEKNRKTCNGCFALLKSPNLHKFIHRASEEAKPHTPWKYLNRRQLEELLLISKKQTNHLKLKVRLIQFCFLLKNCEQ
jgi:hypothetical protein